MSKGKREKSKEKMWCLFCLVNVRRFFAQRNSPFDMGDFSVLAPRALAGGFAVAAQPSFRKLRFLQRISRRTRVRLRGVVLQKSPHLKRLRSARPLARPSGSRYARRFPTKASLSSAHLGANKRRAGTFDIVRLADSSLFTRLGISRRFLPRRSSPNPHRLASSHALGSA